MKKKQWFPVLLWLLPMTVFVLCRSFPDFAEYVFARGIYRYYHTALAFLTGLVPFSLAEILIYLLVLIGLSLFIVWIVSMARGKKVFFRGAYHIFCLAGVIFFLFVFGSGGNYYRYTYAELTGLEVRPSTDQELYSLCMDLTERTNAAREALSESEDGDGVFVLSCSIDELEERARQAMNQLGEKEPLLQGYYPSPKAVLWSRGLSRFGITGITTPYTMEANVNVDAPACSLGASMCHELSHIAGFMREDEANFISYLACTNSDDALLNYSGLLMAQSYAGNALYQSSPALYREVAQNYSEALIRDLSAENAYWEQFEDSATTQIGEKVNDAFLKANRQSEGTKSYGAMVDLLLADFKNRQ